MPRDPQEISHEDRVTIARNAEGMDILSNVLSYLQWSWGIDTPREQMQVNLNTRVILIRCKQKLYNEVAQSCSRSTPRNTFDGASTSGKYPK